MQRGGSGEVPPKITRCLSEAGAVKLDCWPLSTFDPKYRGGWRIQQPGKRKLTRGKEEKKCRWMSVVGKKIIIIKREMRCRKRSHSLMRSRRDWMYRGRFFHIENIEARRWEKRSTSHNVHICLDNSEIFSKSSICELSIAEVECCVGSCVPLGAELQVWNGDLLPPLREIQPLLVQRSAGR